MGKESGKGLQHIIRATGWSLSGLRSAFRHESAFRQETVLFFLLAPLGLWLGRTGTERALLVGCLFIVLVVELLNSAIEAAVDRIGPELHDLSGRAKDLGSAAVFLAILNAVVVWALIVPF